jgi:hypothetical protein
VVLDRGPLSARSRLVAGFVALVLTAWVVAGPVREARALGQRLSPIADPYSESNAIRGALAYLEHGFTSHAGLPETTYGGVYPETGDLRRLGGASHVDTHYPPGAMWLTALMKTACGERPLSCARALPLSLGALGAAVLAFALIGALGLARGIAAALAAFAVPLYANMMLGLHYQGYALALLSLQLGALLALYSAGRPAAARDAVLAAALGFVQGWLSFDYFFLVALAPLPIAVLWSDLRTPTARRSLALLVLASGGGFALAHALHFLQVAAYYGDVTAAVRDLFGAAVERSDPALSPELRASPPPTWASLPWMISSIYLFVLSARETHFGFSLGNALLLALAALVALRGVQVFVPAMRWRLVADASARPAWAVLAAVAVSCAWISVMPGHAHMHPNFIPRHLFLLWLVIVLALLRAFRLEETNAA